MATGIITFPPGAVLPVFLLCFLPVLYCPRFLLPFFPPWESTCTCHAALIAARAPSQPASHAAAAHHLMHSACTHAACLMLSGGVHVLHDVDDGQWHPDLLDHHDAQRPGAAHCRNRKES